MIFWITKAFIALGVILTPPPRYVGLSGAFLVNIETVSYIKGIRFHYFDNWNGKIMSLRIVFTKRLSSYLENFLLSAKGYNKHDPIPNGGDIFTPPNKFSKYLKNCACRWPALLYMWLKISSRHPVKISAWYKYKNFLWFFTERWLTVKSSKLAQNGKTEKYSKCKW